jgi:hypothetical protein
MNSPIPKDFSGLIFAPSEENAVYLLLGLLWSHLPMQIAFASFETDPECYGHGKWIDARGKRLKDGQWQDVAIEFKCQSSSFMADLTKHRGLTVDLLICWEHDAPDVNAFVGEVIELRKIFWNLPAEVRHRLILDPDIIDKSKLPKSKHEVADLISKFPGEDKDKVLAMVDYWGAVVAGSDELKFYAGKNVALRVYSYAKQTIISRVPSAISERFRTSPIARRVQFQNMLRVVIGVLLRLQIGIVPAKSNDYARMKVRGKLRKLAE